MSMSYQVRFEINFVVKHLLRVTVGLPKGLFENTENINSENIFENNPKKKIIFLLNTWQSTRCIISAAHNKSDEYRSISFFTNERAVVAYWTHVAKT